MTSSTGGTSTKVSFLVDRLGPISEEIAWSALTELRSDGLRRQLCFLKSAVEDATRVLQQMQLSFHDREKLIGEITAVRAQIVVVKRSLRAPKSTSGVNVL